MYDTLLHDYSMEGIVMKRTKLFAGVAAFGAVSLIALAFSSSFRPAEPAKFLRAPAMHSVSMDAAPQAKFGLREALSSDISAPEFVGSGKPNQAPADAAEAASEAAAVAADAAGTAPQMLPQRPAIATGQPKIAYVYSYGYQLGADQIPTLQRRHADYCEKQGVQVCRILSLNQSGEEGDYAQGTLELAVAAPRARGFGAELAKQVEAAGGKEVMSAIEGEDLSKQIVDTEARLRARTVLRDRLMEVLATRRGTVAELIEAERGVADVNQEIDEARSWLNEMSSRVEFSRVSIEYSAGTGAPTNPSGFLAPIRTALGSVGTILGNTLGGLIVFITALAPFGLLGWGAWRLWKRFRPVRLPEVEETGYAA
jgi:hypothetical protein